MTEYTSSPEAIREYMSSRERTAYWVQAHQPNETEFYSPSVPPIVLDDPPSPISPPSEVESTHSLPPKMLLRYNDGRPDVPVSHWHHEGHGVTRAGSKKRSEETVSRSQTLPYNSHGRSRVASHSQHSVSTTGRHASLHHEEQHREEPVSPPRSHSPEEIRVLPSHPIETPQNAPSSHYSHRSKSLPANSISRGAMLSPSVSSHHSPAQENVYTPSTHHVHPPQPLPPPQVSFSQSQPLPWHVDPGHTSHNFLPPHKLPTRTPPAIVYAPPHHSKSHYSPPTIYSPYHNINGAPGMLTYSHSAPTPRYPHAGATPYPSVHGSTHLSAVHEEGRSTRSRTRSSVRDRSLQPIRREASSDSSRSSDSHDSGGTYYVIPTPGQKVHIIVSPSNQSQVSPLLWERDEVFFLLPIHVTKELVLTIIIIRNLKDQWSLQLRLQSHLPHHPRETLKSHFSSAFSILRKGSRQVTLGHQKHHPEAVDACTGDTQQMARRKADHSRTGRGATFNIRFTENECYRYLFFSSHSFFRI